MRIKLTVVAKSVIVIFALSACLYFGCGFDPCGNVELKTINSPDGKRKAIIFQRDCGATTGFSSQVSLLHANDKLPREAGNTFIADRVDREAPAYPGGGPEVNLQWSSERELIVKYD